MRTVLSKRILVVGEGKHEVPFLKHLKGLYHGRDSGFVVDIKPATGGSPGSVIDRAVSIPSGYTHRIAIYDTDVCDGSEDKYSKEEGIISWKTNGNLDCLLLSIIESKSYSASDAKSHFQKTYIPKNKRTDQNQYTKLFSKELLELCRSRLPELNRLICLFDKGHCG